MNKKLLTRILWFAVGLLSAYYLYRGIKFRFLTEGNLETKAIWYFSHLATAVAPLLIGPFQFWRWLRVNHVTIHRTMGKIYIVGSLLGGLTAFYLSLTIGAEGSVVPLLLLSTTWLFMTISAWVSIRQGNIVAHRLFVIRSYGLAMVFVFLRLVGDIPQDKLFFFIESPEIRDTTLEWMSWIVPLLTIELIFSWIPSMKRKQSTLK